MQLVAPQPQLQLPTRMHPFALLTGIRREGGPAGAAALQTQPQMRAKRACQREWPRCLPA